MRDYLISSAVWKPHDKECAEHKERVTTLIKYTNMPSGTQDQIKANDEKHIILNLFQINGNKRTSCQDTIT